MTHRAAIVIASFAALLGCAQDESIAKFANPGSAYTLVSVNGTPFPALATIAFPTPGQVTGQAPCNRYFARQTVPYPWFGLEDIGATRMACADLEQETAFFEVLGAATLAEISGPSLILSNTAGLSMVFEAR